MAKKTIYIAGKVTGLDYEYAKHRFQHMEDNLVSEGFKPLNPLKIVDNKDCNWELAMRKCIAALTTADAIVLLDNAQESRGARLEIQIATELQIPICCGFIDLMYNKSII